MSDEDKVDDGATVHIKGGKINLVCLGVIVKGGSCGLDPGFRQTFGQISGHSLDIRIYAIVSQRIVRREETRVYVQLPEPKHVTIMMDKERRVSIRSSI